MAPIRKNIFETIRIVKAFRNQKDVRTERLNFTVPATNILEKGERTMSLKFDTAYDSQIDSAWNSLLPSFVIETELGKYRVDEGRAFFCKTHLKCSKRIYTLSASISTECGM